jgi:beta-xylosidase
MIRILLFSVLMLSTACVLESKTKEAPAPDETPAGKVLFGDPFIMLYNGTYYAYGTSSPDGIIVYTSDELKTWHMPKHRLALHKADVWANRRFWAPEVYHIKGKFYMYYSADEHICVAVADNPLGPFRQEVQKPMIEGEKCIDNSLFIDDDGKAYLYFDRFNDGLNIWVAELKDNLTEIKPETMTPCIHVSQEWETVFPRVNEGSFVIKHKNVYYMTYSANSFESPFYGIGFATAKSPAGPWTKYDRNPIYQNVGELTGIGHSAMFTDKTGDLRIVFHSHQSKTAIHPRVMHISSVTFETKDGMEIMKIDTNYFTPQLIKENAESDTYRNPVMEINTPDPTVIRAPDGSFYLYCTGNLVPVYRSTDMLHWNRVGSAFTKDTRPNFEPKGGLWAPDINYINGKYVLYYSMSVWGGIETCGIGVAVADRPEGPFTDKGALFRSNTIGVKNSIDPFYLEDKGKKYLFWGSFCGIYGIELDNDGLALKAGAEKVRIAGRLTEHFDSKGTEGTYIHKRGKYYYCFGSTGTCCEGANSTYRVVVGRSENLFGPYLTKNGQSMFDNHYETVLQGNSVYAGPGHNAEIITDDEGADWMPYHSYLRNEPKKGRVLCMDRIIWTDDWPLVERLTPSDESKVPIFKRE